MIMNRKFLLVLLLCMPLATFADDAETQYNINTVIETKINSATDIPKSIEGLDAAFEEVSSAQKYESVSEETKREQQQRINDKIQDARNCRKGNSDATNTTKPKTPEEIAAEQAAKEQKVAEAQKAYDDAKKKEQSKENKALTAATTAAMGIGAMELAMGLSEQKADKEAEQDMKAYMSTFRCKYTDGKSFKGGPDPIELPGGNDAKLQSLKSEYMALAADLKERKEALGMKPGIESEVILDKADMGLYDDENVGITNGVYGSLYRAQALNSEDDKAKLEADKSEASKRVKGGAIALASGAAIGIAGNSLINGKLGEKIKEAKDKKADPAKSKSETTTTNTTTSSSVSTATPANQCNIKDTTQKAGKSCKDLIPDRTHVLKAVFDKNGCCIVTCNLKYTRTEEDTCIPNEEYERRIEHVRNLQNQIINKDNIQTFTKTGGDVAKKAVETGGEVVKGVTKMIPGLALL